MSDQSQEQGPIGGLSGWPVVVGLGAALWLLGRAPKSFEDLRKLVLNVVIVGLIALMAFMVARAVDEDLTIMESFAIPKSLEARGYSGTIVLQRVIDQVNLINATAKTRVSRVPISHERQYAMFANLQVPSSGLSVHTVISLLRELIGNDEKIGGEITVRQPATASSPETYELLLRFDIARDKPTRLGRPSDSRHFVVKVAARSDATDIDGLIALAAQAIVEHTNPTVLASYLYSIRQWPRLDPLLDQLVASSRPAIARQALSLRGMRLLDQGRPDDALVPLERAARMEPLSRFALVKYGDGLVKAGRPDDAIRQFERALAVSKSNGRKPPALLYGSWAVALQAKGDPGGALNKLDEAIVAGREDARLHRLRGDLLRDQGDFDAAFDEYRLAISLEPHDWSAYVGWGVALHRSGDLGAAIEKYESAHRADERAPHPYYYRGKALFDRNDLDGAIEAYRKATLADPEFAPAWLEWADCLVRKNEFDDALAKLRLAMKLNPRNLGRVLSELYLVLTTREEPVPAAGAPMNAAAAAPVKLAHTD
jgi:tetratricopeptide (TPR) repeat protein